jgi:hypothetical protein
MRFIPAVCLAIPLLLLGANAAPTNSDSKVQWTDCNSNIPPAAQQNRFDSTIVAELPPQFAAELYSVTKSLQCGRLDVPIDYSKPFADITR